MLWIVGSAFLLAWLILKLLLHKSGWVHTLLFAALIFFVIQFAQDWRTKEYERSLRR
jgi:hypothetical protein